MMFMMPMPPTNKRKAGDEQADGRDGAGDVMKHFDELILLVDREIVFFTRGHVPDFAHGHAQFFPGVIQCLRRHCFDVDRVFRLGTEITDKKPKGNDRLVVEALTIQKATLLIQHADHLTASGANHDFVANGDPCGKRLVAT